MRLPAVAIALAFASGIALGLCPPLATLQASPHFLQLALSLNALLLAISVLLLSRTVPLQASHPWPHG